MDSEKDRLDISTSENVLYVGSAESEGIGAIGFKTSKKWRCSKGHEWKGEVPYWEIWGFEPQGKSPFCPFCVGELWESLSQVEEGDKA